VLNSVTLYDFEGVVLEELTNPLDQSFVTWQAGIPNCPGATPAPNRTWGALKAMYR
jgi:hypothetical protein